MRWPWRRHLTSVAQAVAASTRDDDLARGLGDLLDAQVAGAVQHRGPHGRTTTLIASAAALEVQRAAGLVEPEAVRDEHEHVDAAVRDQLVARRACRPGPPTSSSRR